MKKYLIDILLIIIWMGVIFSFSNQTGEFSGSLSSTLIIKVANIISKEEITPAKEEELINKYSFIVRKGAHFSIYFILALLSFNLARKIYSISPKTFIYTIIFAFIYACTDELHQAFISGRACSFIDVLIDSLGAICATTLLTIIGNIRNKGMTK